MDIKIEDIPQEELDEFRKPFIPTDVSEFWKRQDKPIPILVSKGERYFAHSKFFFGWAAAWVIKEHGFSGEHFCSTTVPLKLCSCGRFNLTWNVKPILGVPSTYMKWSDFRVDDFEDGEAPEWVIENDKRRNLIK